MVVGHKDAAGSKQHSEIGNRRTSEAQRQRSTFATEVQAFAWTVRAALTKSTVADTQTEELKVRY